MKKKIYMMCAVLFALSLTACVEDEGNNTMTAIDEVTIEGIEEEYHKVGYQETLSISVNLKTSLSGNDANKFDYQWFLCNGEVSAEKHNHYVISTEKDLEFPVDLSSRPYRLVFRVTDKQTGMQWEKISLLYVISQFTRGFYLWGDKEDGTCGLDFVSMIEGRDSTVVKDIFRNETGMKHAKNAVFTGSYNPETTELWLLSETESVPVEHDPSQEDFGIMEDVSLDNYMYPGLEVTRPFRLLDIYPHPYGKSNTCQSRSWRVLITEGDAYACTSMTQGESYGNPINRYSPASEELFKPSRYVFHQVANYIPAIALYDETNHYFTAQNANYYALTNMVKPSDSASPFWFDQTKYTPVRHLVYGENADAYSYALMNDENGDYFVYKFKVYRYGASGLQKSSAAKINLAKATDFDKATCYTFFAKQPIILYAAGSTLWAYDYRREEAKEIMTVPDGEVTYVAMDFHSNELFTDFIFATYSPTEKGTIYKYSLEDNPNDIVVKPHEYQTTHYPWKTDLKVKKIEYRNSSVKNR